MTSLVALLLLSLLGSSFATRLVYVEKPSDFTGGEFLAKLTKNADVRGDYGNFALVVDHDQTYGESFTIFAEYNPSRFAYFVVEHVDLAFPIRDESSAPVFQKFANIQVLNKYVFAVLKASENVFTSSVPQYYEIVAVPEKALPAPATDVKFSVSADPDPVIAQLISLVDPVEIKAFATYLSGETSSLITRQSQSTGALFAQSWLAEQFTTSGFTVKTQNFRAGFSPNVIATLTGTTNPTKYVLVTAHYDDRAANVNSPTDRAPGANDNGSGTGALLEIAKRISVSKVSFGYSVILIAFGGEEQGLYGSQYAAADFKAQGVDIIAVLNADMIAYRSPSEPAQLAFVTRSSTLSLNYVLSNISALYVTGLTLGTTSACCTDHSSFYNQGYPATSFFERNGNIADPQYHKVGDVVDRVGYDVEFQYPAIVKSIYASLLTLAEYQV